MPSQDEIIDKAFKKFDRNNDGSISQNELQSALKDAGVTLGNAHVEKLMNTIDRNHDGKITPDEFNKFVKSHPVLLGTYEDDGELNSDFRLETLVSIP